MTSREKFEAWVKFHLDDKFTEVPLYRGNGGLNYLDSQVDLAWIAWQAAETDMAVQLANAESKCRELAAENEKRNTHSEALAVDNAALREVVERMVNQFAMSGISPEEKSINPAKSLMFDAKSALFMPATDAFLAEVRAQVWIEGSEPEEFGRYWVRYETDVGPQYCSAKWMEHNFCAGSNTNIHKIWLADHSRSINSLRGVTHYTKLPDSLEGAAK
ncbi:TPA: hypothetical protein ACSP0P_001399 [Citrobacter freundii]